MLLPAVAILGGDASVAEARAALRDYADASRVVVRRRRGGREEDLWYVLVVGELRRLLAAAADEESVEEVLERDEEVQPAPVLRVQDDDVDTGDLVGVVLRGARVLGIAEPSVSDLGSLGEPEEGPRDRDFRRRDETAGESHVVPVLYATDRRQEGEWEGGVAYGAGRGELTFGVAEVSIPHERERGKVQTPPWWRKEDRARDIVVLSVKLRERSSFVAEARALVAQTEKREALIFVHGFNVDFHEALRRTAQLAVDLDPASQELGADSQVSRLVPILYSWPSQGVLKEYLADETNAWWTVYHFEEVLRLALTELGATTVHVVAHSMGTRVLIEALRGFDLEALPADAAKLREIVFAAPDFDADTFVAFANRFRHRGSFTLYASSRDKALWISRQLRRGLRRAGESGDELVVVDGVQTIDASDVMEGEFLAHSYFGGSTVLSDLFHLLCQDLDPGVGGRQGLLAAEHPGGRYWRFPKPPKT